MLSLKRAHSYLPELQTAELQGHAFADLAGIALHVVVPELKEERPQVRPRPSVFLSRAQAPGGKHADASWAMSLMHMLVG